jgi:hypothetical protein
MRQQMNDDRLLNYLAFIHYGLKERVPIDGFAGNPRVVEEDIVHSDPG